MVLYGCNVPRNRSAIIIIIVRASWKLRVGVIELLKCKECRDAGYYQEQGEDEYVLQFIIVVEFSPKEDPKVLI